MNLRLLFPVVGLLGVNTAFALGLGEMRSAPTLGESLKVELELLSPAPELLDAGCYKLKQPVNNEDFPWVKSANFRIRKGSPNILEINSQTIIRDPIIQLAVQVACGQDVVKEYVMLVSPPKESKPELVAPLAVFPSGASQTSGVDARLPSRVSVTPPMPRREVVQPKPTRAPIQEKPKPIPLPLPISDSKGIAVKTTVAGDRLSLSRGSEMLESSLKFSDTLVTSQAMENGGGDISEQQRENLRLQYRLLSLLNDASGDPKAETKQQVTELLAQIKATEISLQAAPESQNNQPMPAAVPAPLPVPPVAPPPVIEPEEEEFPLELVLGGVGILGLLGGLGFLRYKKKKDSEDQAEFSLLKIEPEHSLPDLEVDPKRGDESEDKGGVSLSISPEAMGMPMEIELDQLSQHDPLPAPDNKPSVPLDSFMSISAATVDEHFEASPVIELADIMLSFGRVKGAAQALQEYIDNNPQEALLPWLRLMDVYRMAGMRAEFEVVAKNLNKNFNVEVQLWDSEVSSEIANQDIDFVLDETSIVGNVVASARSLEDMPRVLDLVLALWPEEEVLSYMHQLLRDNRGGKRVGFPLPVVEELLFLIELKEMVLRMESAPQ